MTLSNILGVYVPSAPEGIADLICQLLAVRGPKDNPAAEALVQEKKEAVLYLLQHFVDTIEVGKLSVDAFINDVEAYCDFISGGPRTLEQLRMSRSEKAPPGYAHHDIIPSHRDFPPTRIHSTSNTICIPRLLSDDYESRYVPQADEFGGLSLQEWLSDQSLETTRTWALRLLRHMGILGD